MLNIRNLFRICKHPSQCTIGRSSMYFSSGSDDGNKKSPPAETDSDDASLEALLKVSFQPKAIYRGKKIRRKVASAETNTEQQLKTNATQHVKKTSPVTKTSIKTKSGIPLEDVLGESYLHSRERKVSQKIIESLSGNTGAEVSSQNDQPDVPPSPQIGQKTAQSVAEGRQPINLSISKQPPKLSPRELLERVKKIAKEVAQGAGPHSSKVADELVAKLKLPKEDGPVNLNDFTYQTGQTKDTSDHSLDLLRNRIVSEEHVYNSPDELKMSSKLRKPHTAKEGSRRITINENLDMSLYPQISLGIFTPEDQEGQRTETFLHTFQRLEQRDLRLSQNYAPRNWFEECIRWTEQGKLWRFPINNEQGLEEEAANVSFTEHIFLEDHLEGWCPSFGPIRHFMELVCLGLSRNPYLSVEEKIDNIMWYRDYFDKNRHILEGSGTLVSTAREVPNLEAQ